MRTTSLMLIVMALTLSLACARQPLPTDKAAQESDLADIQDQRIQSDLNWERLDIGEIDFDTAEIQSVEDGIALIESNIE